jgi:hypothetical protein
MTNGDNPQAGPLSIEQYLDSMEAPAEGQAEVVEEKAEPEGEAEVVEAEEVETETDDQDEPDTEEAAPEAYPVDEYGEITIQLKDGTRTTLADLANGTLRQADYSRKTAELAQTRKELEAAAQELAQRERQLNEQFAQLEEPEPDWRKLAEEDPLGWQLSKLEWDKKQGERQARKRQAEQARQQEIEQFRKWSATKAVEAIAEWTDTKKFNENAEARKKAALAVGFTVEEYEAAVDFRLAALLEKAARYDAGQTKVAAAQKKLSSVPKVLKPGAANSTKADRLAAERAAQQKRRNRPMSVQDYLSTFDIE